MTLPWQQQAIEQSAPHLIELTDYTEDALLYLNKNQTDPYRVPFLQDASCIWHRANGIYNSVDKFEEYAADLHQVRQLGHELNLKTAS